MLQSRAGDLERERGLRGPIGQTHVVLGAAQKKPFTDPVGLQFAVRVLLDVGVTHCDRAQSGGQILSVIGRGHSAPCHATVRTPLPEQRFDEAMRRRSFIAPRFSAHEAAAARQVELSDDAQQRTARLIIMPLHMHPPGEGAAEVDGEESISRQRIEAVQRGLVGCACAQEQRQGEADERASARMHGSALDTASSTRIRRLSRPTPDRKQTVPSHHERS